MGRVSWSAQLWRQGESSPFVQVVASDHLPRSAMNRGFFDTRSCSLLGKCDRLTL